MRTVTRCTVAAFAATTAMAVVLPATTAEAETREIRWGTSAVGSSGHRALVTLAATLNRELEDVDITVLPMPGALMTVRGYALGEIEGFYGADVAFDELSRDADRFEGFRSEMAREPVQSFWAFTMEVGPAIRAADREELTSWSDLSGKPLFTGPLPWDTRAQLERALRAAGVEDFEYVEVDLGMAGSQLDTGAIVAFLSYTAGEADIAPWVAETAMAVDVTVLNPSAEEQERLRAAGLEVVSVSPDVYDVDIGLDEILYVPFFYGFHLGEDFSEDEVYTILTTIEAHAGELAQADPAFTQISRNMPEMQRRGVASSIDLVPVHPGLARYMRERGVWDEAWDDRVIALD
jgi:uncharacterized protein